MEMLFCKTGSTGNCSVIENARGQRLIIDCGIKFDKVNKAVGYNLYNANAVLITHFHS
jgi:Cft2 family RNA processing exonuclease